MQHRFCLIKNPRKKIIDFSKVRKITIFNNNKYTSQSETIEIIKNPNAINSMQHASISVQSKEILLTITGHSHDHKDKEHKTKKCQVS